MGKYEKGSITVTLSLVLFTMMIFVGTLIECVRLNLTKSYSKECLRLATESLLADYEPNLYKHYHIFLLDTNSVTNAKNRVEDYASKSFYNDKLLSMKINSVNSCKMSYLSSNKQTYIKEQIFKYMKHHGFSGENKETLVEYIMAHFSSYADTNLNSTLKKEKIYEIEYIIAGKEEDNDNIMAVTSNIKDFDALKYPVSSYKNDIRKMLMSLSENTIIDRMCDLMLDNINKNCKTNIQLQKCVSGVEVEATFLIDGKFAIRKVNEYNIVSKVKEAY